MILLLGLVHLLYTFYGPKLLPRDPELQTRMQQVSPVITRQTTDVRAVAVRSFDQVTRKWSIWWLDSRNQYQLDVPVIGQFSGTTGTFYADDTLHGAPIKIRFIWNANPGGNPTWEQAFSPDSGATWETNWTMEFSRIEA